MNWCVGFHQYRILSWNGKPENQGIVIFGNVLHLLAPEPAGRSTYHKRTHLRCIHHWTTPFKRGLIKKILLQVSFWGFLLVDFATTVHVLPPPPSTSCPIIHRGHTQYSLWEGERRSGVLELGCIEITTGMPFSHSFHLNIQKILNKFITPPCTHTQPTSICRLFALPRGGAVARGPLQRAFLIVSDTATQRIHHKLMYSGKYLISCSMIITRASNPSPSNSSFIRPNYISLLAS